MQQDNQEKNKVVAGTLYLVATPIGNLSDITERAKKILAEVDFIAAEDTRNSLRLLHALGIRNTCVSYHEHNKRSAGEAILRRLMNAQSCALITDAGMPAISDPGEDLVRLCVAQGIAVRIVPGACAAVSALSLSALSTNRFVFEGFLPVEKRARASRLDKVREEERTLIFYEAPHKLCATLADLCSIFGENRRITLCRELTKINEECLYTTLSQALAYCTCHEPRGEYVLVIAGRAQMPNQTEETENPLCALTPQEHVQHYEALGYARKDAIKAAAKDRGLQKNDFYPLLFSD